MSTGRANFDVAHEPFEGIALAAQPSSALSRNSKVTYHGPREPSSAAPSVLLWEMQPPPAIRSTHAPGQDLDEARGLAVKAQLILSEERESG